MNEWIKKVLDQVKNLWSKWSLIQKLILGAVILVGFGAVLFLVRFNTTPSMTPLLGIPITDQQKRDSIGIKLDEEGIPYTITDDNRIFVEDPESARRAKSILIREDLMPDNVDPWDLFDQDRWTLTDFERNVNLQRSIVKSLEQHISALDDIDSVNVNLVIPDDALFAEDQNPVTASVQITPKPGSDIITNRKKIEGIVKLIQFSVEGLNEDTIVITDQRGVMLNDFTGMEDMDRIEQAKRELLVKKDLENRYKNTILKALQTIYTSDRVQIINLDIDLDMGKKTENTVEYFPITMQPDDPSTPYSELQVIESTPLSEQKNVKEYEGTGFNPEGPSGQESQTPPGYKDLEGLVGRYRDNSEMTNYAVNQKESKEEKSPWTIKRVTIGVALDGKWERKYDDKGRPLLDSDGSLLREYTPVSDNDLKAARALLEPAIGYNQDRGDLVSVQHISFDHTSQFEKEDEAYRKRQQLQRTIIGAMIVIAIVLIAFIAFRLVSREMERRRRLREEELSRQHQAMREAALRSAEEEGVDVEMSVAERARLEMQENAINMAREHPEDVAQLIRSWLAEE
ncbi:flagellar basal-body MS-ring/collar protein FliF [Spirochaeta cellobiosiphila]|uniref:flagellar basal-body MS-ring/collar protein FliF n=1 Tax=Spirochaeta cellobiosiphila TaxID=504483 RepID=UPI0003FC1EF9|nr:flagellar basal-body MS-ring/collar protein FliF [Spirochaeta cellobiosiphila]